MSMIAPAAAVPAPVVYPQGDGKPMADNTRQFRWIVTVEGGLEALFRDESERVRGR